VEEVELLCLEVVVEVLMEEVEVVESRLKQWEEVVVVVEVLMEEVEVVKSRLKQWEEVEEVSLNYQLQLEEELEVD
jgi:hypothetical protein